MKKNKRKNQKGFTLIELLAVVVILLALSVMAISSISAAIERNKAKQDETKKSVLVSYGKLYYDSHKNSLKKQYPSGNGCIAISSLNLSEDEKVDANGKEFTGFIEYTEISDTGTATDFKYVDTCQY